MAKRVESVEELQKYFKGVVDRSEHHAPALAEIIYPLLGLIILKRDENSDIQVREYAGATGNILWVYINGTRYAFRYEHSNQTIEIKKDNYKGQTLHKINNQTGISGLKKIFDAL